MGEKRCWQIWYIGPSAERPVADLLEFFSMYWRDDVVSVDRDKINRTFDELTRIYGDELTRFEIREVLRD